MAIPPPHDWHARTGEEVLQVLDSRHAGLSAGEARSRFARHGPNTLPAPPRPHPLVRLLAQFHSALIYVLLAAALAAGVLGHVLDAGVILAVVGVNALVGFLQEGKAERALAAIRSLAAP